MDLNRATIIGRLTRDPELRSTTTGKTVASMTVVTNLVWTDQSGVKQEKPEFHNCVVWGKLADIVGQYLTKGRQVFVEGRIETRDWTGQDGVKRYRTEIVVDNLIMLGGGNKAGSGAPQGGAVPTRSSDESVYTPPQAPQEEIKVEDIPF